MVCLRRGAVLGVMGVGVVMLLLHVNIIHLSSYPQPADQELVDKQMNIMATLDLEASSLQHHERGLAEEASSNIALPALAAASRPSLNEDLHQPEKINITRLKGYARGWLRPVTTAATDDLLVSNDDAREGRGVKVRQVAWVVPFSWTDSMQHFAPMWVKTVAASSPFLQAFVFHENPDMMMPFRWIPSLELRSFAT